MRRFFLLVMVGLVAFFGWRLRPTMGPKESYNDFFPTKRFLAKVHSPVPEWMEKQLAADFKEVPPITAQALEKAYHVIRERIQNPIFLYHYRILDNQLYKYVPPGVRPSARDTYYEKALKTLLSQIALPDLDFILCPMDGIPEAIVAPDFYLMDNPAEQIPILGQAKLKEPLTRLIVLIPDQLSLARDWYGISAEILSLNEKIPWSEKVAKAFWRGGMSDNGLLGSPRLSICRIAKQHPNLVNAASNYCPAMAEIVQNEQLPLCDTYVSKEEHLHYKYQPTINGNMCTYPGYQWRLLSNSLTLKQESDQIQWFYSALEPYKHYLPIATDISDLPQKIEWAESHETEVLAMIANARQFASDHLLYEDCYRYFYLVLQTYASHQQIDFRMLKRETKKDPCWINIQYRKRLAFYKTLKKIF